MPLELAQSAGARQSNQREQIVLGHVSHQRHIAGRYGAEASAHPLASPRVVTANSSSARPKKKPAGDTGGASRQSTPLWLDGRGVPVQSQVPLPTFDSVPVSACHAQIDVGPRRALRGCTTIVVRREATRLGQRPTRCARPLRCGGRLRLSLYLSGWVVGATTAWPVLRPFLMASGPDTGGLSSTEAIASREGRAQTDSRRKPPVSGAVAQRQPTHNTLVLQGFPATRTLPTCREGGREGLSRTKLLLLKTEMHRLFKKKPRKRVVGEGWCRIGTNAAMRHLAPAGAPREERSRSAPPSVENFHSG